MNITVSSHLSLLKKIIHLNPLNLSNLRLSFEDGLSKFWILFLHNFELPFDLISGLGHFGGDHCEIAAISLQKFDK